MGTVIVYDDHDVYVLWTEGPLDDGCVERLANEEKTMAGVRGGTEMKASVKHPN